MASKYLQLGKGKIPWSFYWHVVKKCGGDIHAANDIFYRARDKDNPVQYISAGMRDGWIFHPYECNRQHKQDWINSKMFGMKPEKKKLVEVNNCPASMSDILKDLGL